MMTDDPASDHVYGAGMLRRTKHRQCSMFVFPMSHCHFVAFDVNSMNTTLGVSYALPKDLYD
jgi:hypothetical protein